MTILLALSLAYPVTGWILAFKFRHKVIRQMQQNLPDKHVGTHVHHVYIALIIVGIVYGPFTRYTGKVE